MPVVNTESYPGSRRYIETIKLELAANVKAIRGDFAVTNGGQYSEPGKTDTGLTMLGRYAETIDNTGGAAGAKSAKIRLLNDFWADGFLNDTVAPVTSAHLWTEVYLKDSRTVTADGTGRTAAGLLVHIDADMVYVKLAGGV
jgi:hypothetical protein